jgi:hypothetical protein
VAVQTLPVRRAAIRTAIYAEAMAPHAAGVALCLLIALVSGYFCLTQLIVTRSANISNSANVSNSKDGNVLILSSGPISAGEKPPSYGFDGFIWIGSRTVPRVSIDTSAAIAQIQVADQLLQPSCHPLQGASEPPGQVTLRTRCDVDLSGMPRNHFDRLTVALSGSSKPFALNIVPTAVSPAALVLGSTALIAILVSVLLLCRAANLRWIISAIFALGLGTRLIYWAKTPPLVRTHDGFAHAQYVALVALNWIRPDRNAGWETHQAPLYYYVGAGVVSLTHLFRFHSVGAALATLQSLSLAFSGLTAIVAFLCFKECAELFCPAVELRERAVAIALALYIFWPTVVMDSVRIGNDSLLLLFSAIFLFCILRWHSHQSSLALVAASLAVALAIATKASGIILLPVLGLAAVLEWRSQPTRRAVYKHLLWLAPVLLFAGLITFGSALRERMSGRDTSVLLANNVPGPEFAVANRPGNYLRFNPQKFVLTPFTDLFSDQYGRQKFWHYFWKTSLVGEFRYTNRFESLCASFLSGFLLLLLILTVFSIFFRRAERPKPLASVLAFSVLWISGTIAFSVLHPFASNRDFRYAAPALVCICWFAASSSSGFASKGWLRIAKSADILLVLFIACSIGFAIGLPAYP